MIIALQTLLFFRESLIAVINHFITSYYKKFSLQIKGNEGSDDEDSDDHVFSEYDEEKGVVFYPPVYAQRYAAVSDCLMDDRWSEKLEKVVDFGYHDLSFIKYLVDVPGIKHILGVDIEAIPFRCSSDLLAYQTYTSKRENPLKITLFEGNAADPDFRLIGCDAVIAIEMIEHMLPHDLERMVHTVFGFIKPQVAIFTTPNGDFNVLFKALEKNGLRRLDHFFEWSKEQFHDWCSNIVTRYSQYTVMTKGIGPGPIGTSHLGCCSQLAMFVAKDYHKQQDLDLNSFSLVAKAPSKKAMSDMVCSWNSSEDLENKMLCVEDNIESFTELLDRNSCMTIILTSPSFSLQSLEYEDKILQCNLDIELGKNFLMFDDNVYYNVLMPTRQKYSRVYEIEDIASRLNCGTLQVKKFSKITQNILAKNKIDSFAHTREIVDEIKNLTKMLNFNKDSKKDALENLTWSNINWGENAPYWNQYYKIVKEYNYPYETKSDDCRILDLISEEINRLIDNENDEEFLVDSYKLEIPISYLMDIVKHITSDADKVKELLEWNGYEIVNDVLVHSRLAIDNIDDSIDTEDDWPDDAISDLDATDARSTTISDRSIVPDYYGRSLRRALDRKVRKLRSLFLADEDSTSELDRVVCQLMKLALNTSSGRGCPPPAIWMQYKLLDLLTLTEKAIERRRQHILDRYSLKAIEYCKETSDKDITLTLNKIKEDETAENIVSKYYHLVPSLGKVKQTTFLFYTSHPGFFFPGVYIKVAFSQNRAIAITNLGLNKSIETRKHLDVVNETDYQEFHYQFEDSDFDDVTSNEFKDNGDLLNTMATSETADNQIVPVHNLQDNVNNKIDALPDWDSSNLDLVPYQSRTDLSDLNSSDETNYSIIKSRNNNNKRNNEVFKYITDIKHNASLKLTIASQNKVINEKLFKSNRKIGNKKSSSKTKLVKKVYKKSSYYNNFKYQKMEYNNNKAKERKKIKDHQLLQSSVPQPIPGNFLELCYPNVEVDKNWEESDINILPVPPPPLTSIDVKDSKVASTEVCVFLNLVTEFGEETIALQRNIGTDPDADMIYFENEILLESVTNITNDDSFCYIKTKLDPENEESQSIFLYDINEPSTSKGVRHFSTDVQCGPDVSITNVMLSASTSFAKVPKCYTKGIKIGDSFTDISVNKRTFDFGTCTENSESVTFTKKSIGIKIKDSDMYIGKDECSTMTQFKGENEVQTVYHTTNISESKSLKCTNTLQRKESVSKAIGTLDSLPKSPARFINSSKNKKDFQIQLTGDYVKPKLSCGGIHVHSFKDRLVSEDLVYQGEWQRSKPKTLAKKNPNEPMIKKPRKINIILKENPLLKNVSKNEIKTVTHKPISFRNPEVDLEKYFSKKNHTKRLNPTNTTVLKKSNKNEVKVASKIAMSSTVSKNTKSIYGAKRPVTSSTPIRTNNNIEKPRRIMKNYIPLYLRKKIQSSMIDEQTKENNIHRKNKENTDLQTLNVKELTQDLLKMSDAPHTNIRYLVFRNEIKTNKSIGTHSPPTDIRNSSIKRSYSPVSQHSSTCSSPNSVATVRAASTRTKPISNRKNATSSDRSNSGNLETEAKCLKNKKYTRRVKINKKHPNTVALNDKENLPESSRNTSCAKDNEKNAKKVFVSRTKSVYMAQMTENSNLGSLPVNSKSKMHLNQPIKYLAIKSPTSEKMQASVSSISTKRSYNKNFIDEVIQNQKLPEKGDLSVPSQSNTTTINSRTSLDNSKKAAHQTKSGIISAIRQLVEDNLNVVETNYSDGHLSDSETIILSRDDYNMSFDDSLSPISINTLPTNDDTYSFESDMDNTLINNPDMINRIESMYTSNNILSPDVELDLLSFKSIASASNSKFSEYYLADNELDNNILSSLEAVNMTSVEDIYERKDPNIMPNMAGVLAIQAFSGFSMNMDPIAGEQPDLVNLIDSETGSLALDSARQTASEELFVSGRSSDTYESCLYDDEADVPNWLFNIISQQQSIEESEAEDTLPVMVPLTDPEYDGNGNVEPGVGVGAGAGDGRGIHSDHSQDSSGRGTSLSSSATSSGPQSEAILVDNASALVAHPVYGLNPVTNTQNQPTSVSVHVTEANRNDRPNRLNGVARGPINPVLLTSDVDADISSLDTDAVDSDN